MARLGELLVASGVLEADKVEQALRAQVVWGGRLGTNLIELGFIDLDELSRALGRQHNMPAALARHFEKADPALQLRCDAELVDRYSFVPLVALADGKIAIAGVDPLDAEGRAEVAAAFGISPENLVVSVAAEQRMRYQLERVYGIARSSRYLRSRGKSIPPFPKFADFEIEDDSDVEVDIPITWEEPPPDPDLELAPSSVPALPAPPAPIPFAELPDHAVDRAPLVELEALLENAMATTPTAVPEPTEPTGRDRRRYVKTLTDDVVRREPEPEVAPPKEDDKPKEPKAALGRLALRKVVAGSGPIPSVVESGPKTDTLADAARAIRRGANRDRVALLVIDALTRFSTCDAAMLLIIRGGSATSWKIFVRDSDATGPELAVPLDQPGLVPKCVQQAATVRCEGDLDTIDMLLLRALGRPEADLVCVPVAVGGRVICVIALAMPQDAAIANIETIATSAGTAFLRLIRDASR